MPLYIEILDQSADTVTTGEDTQVLSAWTSENTSEAFRLVDVPDEHETPGARVRAARILYC
ncbi:MAG TPA: hypothetical protein VHU90_07450 [Galbitalea sp.]|jgi:hypothetical protein|nr:hypothetical protein [Galbitalea sp.]